uniref:F-box protein At3g07870-like n=1 Tax=Fragaria vesca subsp. vesca TaxID=101020 RepID=UPI0005CB5D17|nr:PREDICTED: F-box protein At3g07870-like [Fragaria vesca subsp. vesca]
MTTVNGTPIDAGPYVSGIITKTFHPLQYGSNFLEMREYSSEIIVSQKYNYQVHCIFSNLICFKDVSYGGPSFLLDPPKRQVLELPASKVPASIGRLRGLLEWLAMGFDDTTGTLKILRVSGRSRYKNLVAQVLELGTSSWREIVAVPPCNLSHKNVSAYGDMHWWITRKPRTREESKIVSFDFKKEEFYRTPHPTLRSEGSRLSDSNLVNLRGCLAIVDVVVVNLTIIDMWVLKNYEEKTWVRDYCFEFDISLGEIIGSCGVWEHGIYFKDAIGTGAQNRATAMFLDLRGVSTGGVRMELAKCLLQDWTIISYYTESLISLKHYGNLVKPEASDEYPEGAWFL